MRWVVELPAPSGGTAATVTVESDSWAGALSSARGGVSIRKFRCEFENDGVVRVNDLEANERYTVRPYRATSIPPGDASRSGLQDDAAGLGNAALPTASGRTSRIAVQSSGSGSFLVAPPPGNSVALPPRASAPPTASVSAEPAATKDAPVETPVEPSVPSAHQKPSDAVATAAVVETPIVVAVEPYSAPVLVIEPVAVVVPEAVVVAPEVPAPAKPMSHSDFAPTVVDLPIFVAPPRAVVAPVAVEVPTPEPQTSAPVAPEPAVQDQVIAHGSEDGALVASTLLFERDQDPSATNPLTYRERVYAVASGTSEAQAEALARQTLTTLMQSLATRPRGRYVIVAVFDHTFSHRPSESPIVVLRWKDWHGDVAELQVRPSLPTVASDVAPAPVQGTGTDVPQESADFIRAASDAPAALPVSAIEAPLVVAGLASLAEVAPVSVRPPTPALAPVEPVVIVSPAVTPDPVEASAAPTTVESPAVTVAVKPVDNRALPPTAKAFPAPAAVVAAPIEEAVDRVGDPASESPLASTAQALQEDEPNANDSAGAIGGDAGSRRKKRRGRRESQSSFPKIDPATAVTPKVAEVAVVAADRKRFEGGRRGPDLLSDLFDSVMELSFQQSIAEVCTVVASVLTDNLRCDAVLVFTYDINRDEFVVQGEANTGRLEQRVRAKVGSYGTATRSKRGVILRAAQGDDGADAGCQGGAAIFVPALFRDRLFALVQVARLPGSPGFEADELDAVTYVAGQLAEALSLHANRQTHADVLEKKDPVGKVVGPRR